jgi:hypothetical protein
MRTNPGGGLAPEEVVGRDVLIAELWDKLERHGVMMTAEDELAPELALTIGDWWNRVSIQTPDLDKEAFRSTLNLLEQDHYIYRNDAGAYKFRFSLVQRYWHQQRGN